MPTNRLTRTRSSRSRAQQNSPRSKRQSGGRGGVATRRQRVKRLALGSAIASRIRRVTRTGAKARSASTARAQGTQAGREIPRNQWSSFLNRFSRDYDGWSARVDVSEPGTREGTEARLMPLLGISIDMKPGAKDTTSIMLDVRPNVHLTHWVPKTKKVIFNEQKKQLTITSTTGDQAIVRLEKARKVGWS